MKKTTFRSLTCAIVFALVVSTSASSRVLAVTPGENGLTARSTVAGSPATAINAPAQAPRSAASVAAGATISGVSCTPSCDLYATTGTLALPSGASVPIYGYSTSPTPGTASIPGPTLIADQGAAMTVRLHNTDLPSATSLLIPSAPMPADTVGITAGAALQTYAVPGLGAGTYVYEAGLTADGPRQVAMGLFGALIVRPTWSGVAITSGTTTRTDAGATVTSGSALVRDSAVLATDVGSSVTGVGIPSGATMIAANAGVDFTMSTPAQTAAYGPSTAYDDEALVVLSDVDPRFNNAPSTFDIGGAEPKYWLINGRSYPATAPIATGAGRTVLLRYINAGLMHHTMSLLGLRQSIVGIDASPLTNRSTVVAQTISVGGATEALVAIPAAAPSGAKYALFEAAMHLDNNGARVSSATDAAIAFGGMLTFLELGGTTTAGGPTTRAVAVTPSPTNGTVSVTLSATLSASSGATLTAAEYFVDTTGANGAGCALSPAPSGSSATASWSIDTTAASAPCVALAGLSSGNHAFYVHARDTSGSWGAFASAVLALDTRGPSTTAISLTPDHANGTTDVAIQATVSDAASGNQVVTAAEYAIDSGTASALVLGTVASTTSATGTIAASTVLALADGAHTISIRAQDAFGNWGASASSTLTVDRTGPAASGGSATPNPTDGTFGVQGGSGGAFYERIDATVNDPLTGAVNSPIVNAEYFVDTVTADGTGYPMLATDGTYGSSTEKIFQLLDLFAIQALAQGQHTVFVHGKDAAGNWGALLGIPLTIDKTAPSVTSAAITPNPSAGANAVTLTATATDPANTGPTPAPASNIVSAEWFIGADPGAGLGTPIAISIPAPTVSLSTSINVSGLAIGSYTVSVRVRDAARHWSPVRTAPLTISALFADGFDSGTFSAWSTGGTAGRISVVTSPTQAGAGAMRATINSGTSGYVQDNTPNAETRYRARFYFNPNDLNTGNGTARTIFTALNDAGTATVFTVQMQRIAGGGGTFQLRATVSQSGGTTNTNWFTIGATTYTAIEVGWTSGAAASITLSTGGVLRQTLTGLDTSGFTLGMVRMGPQGSLPSGGPGQYMLFDSFVSTRGMAVIGP